MDTSERRILTELLAVARGRLTRGGVAAITVQTERFGYCRRTHPCGPTCSSVNAAIGQAEALLAESEPVAIVQMCLEPTS